MQLTAIIVDDEQSGRENLAGLLRTHLPGILVLAEARSVADAINLIEKHAPLLVFLDIEMPGGNGFRLLEHFRDFPFEVIFVTAYDNYAIRAIRFSAADYILKPINVNELISAVEKVELRIRQKSENERIRQLYYNVNHPQNPKIGLPSNDGIEFAEVKNIIRCQGESNYTKLFFVHRKPLLVARTLVDFEELLAEHGFLRVHKTHLVNLSKVKAMLRKDGCQLLMSDGEIVCVSRRRKEEVVRRVKQFVSA